MGSFEAIVRALIYICLVVLAMFLVLWVLAEIGLALPAMVIKILWVIVVLLCILVLFRLFWPMASGFAWFPPRNPPQP